MSTPLGSVSLSLSKQVRTWRTNIESAFGQKPVVTAHRQLVGVDSTPKIVTNEGAPTVERVIDSKLLGDTSQQVTLANGTVLTLAEVFEAVPAFIDKWSAEDKKAADDAEAARLQAIEDAKTETA